MPLPATPRGRGFNDEDSLALGNNLVDPLLDARVLSVQRNSSGDRHGELYFQGHGHGARDFLIAATKFYGLDSKLCRSSLCNASAERVPSVSTGYVSRPLPWVAAAVFDGHGDATERQVSL